MTNAQFWTLYLACAAPTSLIVGQAVTNAQFWTLYLACAAPTSLIVGHAVWGRRWMLNGLRDIWSVYVRLFVWARRKVSRQRDSPTNGAT